MSNTPLRIIFAGTPEFAASSLQAVIKAGHEVVAVYTQPDRPAGRGRKLKPSAVKALALEHNLPVEQPLSLKDADSQQTLAAYNADLMIVVAYGLLLPQAVLDTPRLGCINVHASLLPRWRGAAPIHRALLAGDETTGITIMQMDAGLDTGAMLSKCECPISATETSGELHDRLAVMGAQLLVDTLAPLANGQLTPEVQNGDLACYAAKLEKQEGEVDWQQPAATIDRQIRGLSPWPVSFTHIGDDTLRLHRCELTAGSSDKPAGTIVHADKKGLDVVAGDGALVRLTKLQLPGGKALDTAALLNSAANAEKLAVGTQFNRA